MRDRCNSMSYVDSAHHLPYFRYRSNNNIMFIFFITHYMMTIITHDMTIGTPDIGGRSWVHYRHKVVLFRGILLQDITTRYVTWVGMP